MITYPIPWIIEGVVEAHSLVRHPWALKPLDAFWGQDNATCLQEHGQLSWMGFSALELRDLLQGLSTRGIEGALI